MCHFPISHKGWLRQLRPSVSAKTIIRFERLVDSQLGNRTKPADIPMPDSAPTGKWGTAMSSKAYYNENDTHADTFCEVSA